MEKKDLDRRVRDLNTLKRDHEVADLTANYFDFDHPLPTVIFVVFSCLVLLSFYILVVIFELLLLFRITDFSFLVPLSQREGPFHTFLFPWPPKPLKLRTAKMEMKAKIR
jgi:hypothetical protein